LACHDADGRGATVRQAMPDIPDLTDLKWQISRSDLELQHSILEGKGKFMAPMKDKLAAADAEKLVALVRGFREGQQKVKVDVQPIPPGPVEPAIVPKDPQKKPGGPTISAEMAARLRAASEQYRHYCLICHGADGKGSAMRPSMPTICDFTSRAWQDRLNNTQMAVSILDGKGTFMPAFRGRVNDEQAQDLVAYIRAFGPAGAPPPDKFPSDFEKRYRDLQRQWEELQKQLQELKRPAGKAMVQPDQWPPAHADHGLACRDDYFGATFGGGSSSGADLSVPDWSRSSLIGCEKMNRLAEGSGGGLGGGTSCQRRNHSIRTAFSLPVRLARTRMWAAAFL
jgi:mono/diheme cytochrome c family protein